MYNTFFNLQAKAFENIQLQQMKIKILQCIQCLEMIKSSPPKKDK